MPKERRDRSVSFDRFQTSPYPWGSSHARQCSAQIPQETEENFKEWEEARCPVCLEHPHNAVLLICSSHEKCCRPYICDTSSRHSNCLDQFRKSFAESSSTTPVPEESPLPTINLSEVVPLETATTDFLQEERSERVSLTTPTTSTVENEKLTKLVCPLCRGNIKDWIVVDPARRFMNAKPRSCSCETCDFSGSYTDLRKHARLEHPLVRPSEADPERQRSWRRLERQRDLGDLLSTLQSSFGEERGDDSILPIGDGDWLSVYFLIHVFRPGSSLRSSSWSGSSRTRAQVSIRRRPSRVWGESYDGEIVSSRDEDNESSDGASGPRRPTRRRRTMPDQP